MLDTLNRTLGEQSVDNRFVALAFGVYDSRDRSFVVANAGFSRPLLVRDGAVEEIQIEGVPLGLLPDVTYKQQRLELVSGDLVVLTSDGVSESTNRKCEEFGARRMRALLIDQADRSAQEIADELLSSTARHDTGNRPLDDRTVVVLKVL
jgi:sigma-B regulation protein RsbU (phosphoserine phosphatase)